MNQKNTLCIVPFENGTLVVTNGKIIKDIEAADLNQDKPSPVEVNKTILRYAKQYNVDPEEIIHIQEFIDNEIESEALLCDLEKKRLETLIAIFGGEPEIAAIYETVRNSDFLKDENGQDFEFEYLGYNEDLMFKIYESKSSYKGQTLSQYHLDENDLYQTLKSSIGKDHLVIEQFDIKIRPYTVFNTFEHADLMKKIEEIESLRLKNYRHEIGEELTENKIKSSVSSSL
ncbi:MAG: hypothetical protein IBX55_00345 [Methyloprofundus sp.]|nr:hypothetical protein [Methyloprofundus sp.]